jgi:hypothetical protein
VLLLPALLLLLVLGQCLVQQTLSTYMHTFVTIRVL